MPVKREFALDVGRLSRRSRSAGNEARRLHAELAGSSRLLWRPDIRLRLNEWVADFALAGQAALESPEFASHMVMLRLFYLGLTPYDSARHFLGLSEMGLVQMDGRCAPSLRQGIVAPRHVPSRKYSSEAA
jgi:hypothetical protein